MPKKSNKKNIIAPALGTVLATAAAGYYFYGSKDAKQHRNAAAAWARGLKRTAVKEIKLLKKVDQKAILKAIAAATEIYEGAKDVNRSELMTAARELRTNWKSLMAEASRTAKGATKTVERSAKRAVAKTKKVAKKAAKKASGNTRK